MKSPDGRLIGDSIEESVQRAGATVEESSRAGMRGVSDTERTDTERTAGIVEITGGDASTSGSESSPEIDMTGGGRAPVTGDCGRVDEPCCENETCEGGDCNTTISCRAGLTCVINATNGMTTTWCEDPTDCGELGERCCDGQTCSDGGICEANQCVRCGLLDGRCCPDGNCFEGVCDQGMCVTELACGYLGRECCRDRCLEGSCLEGRCMAFGGAYAELTLDQSSELIGNPYTGQGCPEDFTDHQVLDSWLEIGSTERSELHVCLSELQSGDRAETYVGHSTYSAEPICIESCDHVGGARFCECRDADEEMTIKALSLDPSESCSSFWTWCAADSPAPSNFGGTYVQIMPDPNNSSACGECVPNPLTGSCGCPGQTRGLRVPIVYLASSSTSWTCNADLVICIADSQ